MIKTGNVEIGKTPSIESGKKCKYIKNGEGVDSKSTKGVPFEKVANKIKK